MARAEIRKADQAPWKADIGRAVERIQQRSGLSLKEFAGVLGRDERQVKRWMTADERPQFDAIFAVEALRQLVVIVLAELAGQGVEVETTITLRRPA